MSTNFLFEATLSMIKTTLHKRKHITFVGRDFFTVLGYIWCAESESEIRFCP
jgi:hypothetical protein